MWSLDVMGLGAIGFQTPGYANTKQGQAAGRALLHVCIFSVLLTQTHFILGAASQPAPGYYSNILSYPNILTRQIDALLR